MASPQTTSHVTAPEGPSEAPGQNKRRGLFFTLLAFLVIAALVGWQLWTTHSSSTDPTVANRPLSNPNMHLHTMALGGRPGVLYLGTHYGLFTSTDGGRTWPEPRGVLNTLMITVISVNPADPSSLALVGVPSVSKADQGGLYFSSDNGKTWNLRTPPALPGTAYPFTVQAGYGGAGHFYAFYLYAGWFETRDMGKSWRALTSKPLSDMQSPTLLAFPEETGHLLLGGEQGLFESKDAGVSWTQLTSVNGAVQELLLTQDKHVLCQTDQVLYRWGNDSASITPLSLPNKQPFSRLVSDASGMVLYGLSGRMLWSSEDGGKSWQKRQQFERGDLIALLIDPQQSSRLYAAFFLPPKVLVSENRGDAWSLLTSQ